MFNHVFQKIIPDLPPELKPLAMMALDLRMSSSSYAYELWDYTDDHDLEIHLSVQLLEEKALFSAKQSQNAVTQKASHLASDLIDYFLLI